MPPKRSKQLAAPGAMAPRTGPQQVLERSFRPSPAVAALFTASKTGGEATEGHWEDGLKGGGWIKVISERLP